MIYVIYFALAAGVVFASNMAAKYVDILDKQTRLSGAFIGGVMLSAVTSLPELFTSLSSTLMLNKPGLCLGNIMGSDMFNLFLLAVLILIFIRDFSRASISGSHTKTALTVLLAFAAILLNELHILDFSILTVSITSIILLVLYIISLRFLSGENGESSPEETAAPAMSMKQLITRLVISSAAIVIISILLTFATDKISVRLNLEQGFAGALLLGVATSLPELSSTFTLFRIKNHDIAVGNIVGSNIFNFIILSLCDILYFGRGLYDFADESTRLLIILGTIQSALMLIMLKWKNKATRIICPAAIIVLYMMFLAIH